MMILVDTGQPLLKPSMSQLQLTKCLEKVKQEDTFALEKDSVVRKKEDFTK